MPDPDDATIGGQPALEQPAHWAGARVARLLTPAHWAGARVARLLIAVIVVLGSAGAGFLASRIWPLAAFSGSKSQVASTSKPRAFEPSMLLPVVAFEHAKFAEPSALVAMRPLEQPQPPAPTEAANTAK